MHPSENSNKNWRTICACVVLWMAFQAIPTRAEDDRMIPAEELPSEVANRIREGWGEPLYATQVNVDNISYFEVVANKSGNISEIYAAPDGSAFILKSGPFTIERWATDLAISAIIFLVPSSLFGLFAWLPIQVGTGQTLPFRWGWLAAWVTAGTCIAIILFNIATVRHKDSPVLIAYCVLWGAIAATMIEIIVLILPLSRTLKSRRPWILYCCIVLTFGLLLTIPLDILRIERENRHAIERIVKSSQYSTENQ